MYRSVRLVKGNAAAIAVEAPARRSAGVEAVMSRLRAEYPAQDPAATAADSAGAEAPGQGAYLARCVMLQTVGAALIAGLCIAGVAGKPFQGDNAFLCWIIVAMGLGGIACVFTQRWRDVHWIATHVVRIGLLGTVIGLIVAFSAAAGGDSSDPSAVKAMVGAVVNGMYVSLYATLLGIATNLWLKINLRLLGNDHG
jgi:hypothetical protein